MTHEQPETLFELTTPNEDPGAAEPTISHIDLAVRPATSETVTDDEFDHMAEALGSYYLARVYFGLLPEENKTETKPQSQVLPGKPLSYTPIGHVRDYHDGGRADMYRGGIGAPELGSEADVTLRMVLPELMSMRDRTTEANIREDFESEVIESNYLSVDAPRSNAIARYRTYIEKHYPELDSELVNELLADFAETLLPPSPLR